MSKVVKVGVMPGRIQDFIVEEGTSIADVLALAELSADGYEVKVDGAKVTNLTSTKVTASTNLVLLAKQVKGNAERIVKVGQMPGRIQDFAVDSTTTVAELIALAGLSADGYEVKVDGAKTTDLSAPIGSGNLVLLAKQVKGNYDRVVKVGVMPGRINDYSVDSSTSIADVLALAELSADGYEVKADGRKITDFSQAVGSTNLILLAKQVKGN